MAYNPIGRRSQYFMTNCNNTKGFSLTELMLMMLIMAVLAAVAIPRFNLASVDRQNVKSVAYHIASQLELARQMAISDAATNTEGFEFVLDGPKNSYCIFNADTSDLVENSEYEFDEDIQVNGKKTVRFGPAGNISAGGSVMIKIWSGDLGYDITVNRITGMVKCEQSQQDD